MPTALVAHLKFPAAVACAIAILAAVLVLPPARAASAAVPVPTAPSAALPPGAALDPVALDAWMDGRIGSAIERGDLGSVSVVVVDRSGQVYSRGWGHADRARRVRMDPSTHLVRPGSVSKLFTWIAVMQLVERGRIDLDADVNTYLDFRIPADGHATPVTMRHLMTHRAGFEERVGDLIVSDPSRVITNAQWLRAKVPARVFPPGQVPAYSNYGTALAGYIVERVSGVPFEQYVRDRVMVPMGMTRATFAQPVPAALAGDEALAYDRASKGSEAFEWVVPSPAGSLSATPEDMGRFMTALLSGRAPLKPATLEQMWRFEVRAHPSLLPMALGFYRADRGGHRILAHGGDTRFFHSDLLLMPDAGIGLFIAISGNGPEGQGPALRKDVVEGFIDRFLPARARAAAAGAAVKGQADGVAGRYQSSRASFTNVLAFLNPLQAFEVVAHEDGSLLTPALRDRAGVPVRWLPFAPDVWRSPDGHTLLAATRDGAGHVTQLGLSTVSSIVVWHPMQASALHLPMLLAAYAVLMLVLLGVPVRAVLRRRFGVAFAPDGTRRIIRWGVLVLVLGTVALVMAIANAMTLAPADAWIRAAQLLMLVGALALVPAVRALVAAVRLRQPWWRILIDALVAVAIAYPVAYLAIHGFFRLDIGY